jgi:hypothetical protein
MSVKKLSLTNEGFSTPIMSKIPAILKLDLKNQNAEFVRTNECKCNSKYAFIPKYYIINVMEDKL